MRRHPFTLTLCAVVLAACTPDAPLFIAEVEPSFNAAPAQGPAAAALLDCVLTMRGGALQCSPARPDVAAAARVAVYGGPLARMEARPVLHNPATGEYAFDVRLANHALRSALNTCDGRLADPDGIRAVIVDGPRAVGSGAPVKVLAPAARGQVQPSLPRNTPYAVFSGIVPVGGRTAWQRWSFEVPTSVQSVRFLLAVYTEVECHLRISEVMPGQASYGVVTAGAYYEVINLGEFEIAPGLSVPLVVEDSLSGGGGRIEWAGFPVRTIMGVGERRVVGAAGLARWLPVSLTGTYAEKYVPDPKYGHALRIVAGKGGKVLDRVTFAASLPMSGQAYERQNLGNASSLAASVDVRTWRRATAPIVVRCETRNGCPSLRGTPGR